MQPCFCSRAKKGGQEMGRARTTGLVQALYVSDVLTGCPVSELIAWSAHWYAGAELLPDAAKANETLLLRVRHDRGWEVSSRFCTQLNRGCCRHCC